MLGEGDAALVSWCRPGVLAKPGIVREHARVGRQELSLIAMDRRKDATRYEVCGILEQPDEFIDHLGDLDGHGFAGHLALGKEEYGHRRKPLAKFAQKRCCQIMRLPIVVAEVPIEQHGAKRCIGADDRPTVLERQGPDDLDIAQFQSRARLSAARPRAVSGLASASSTMRARGRSGPAVGFSMA